MYNLLTYKNTTDILILLLILRMFVLLIPDVYWNYVFVHQETFLIFYFVKFTSLQDTFVALYVQIIAPVY